jgi:hypothetical protein
MRTRLGPFSIYDLARAIARLPGRAEVDKQEAIRITDDIAEWYLRGEFHDDEVVAYVAYVAGEPPALRSLAEIKDVVRRRGEDWCLSQPEWRTVCLLTAPAALRYLEGCGYDGAPRVRREWFGGAEAAIPEATQSEAPLPRKGRRGKPGPKPRLRTEITNRMLDDLQSRRRTPEELEGDKLAALAKQYGGTLNTAKAARQDALKKFAKFQNQTLNLTLQNSEH